MLLKCNILSWLDKKYRSRQTILAYISSIEVKGSRRMHISENGLHFLFLYATESNDPLSTEFSRKTTVFYIEHWKKFYLLKHLIVVLFLYNAQFVSFLKQKVSFCSNMYSSRVRYSAIEDWQRSLDEY